MNWFAAMLCLLPLLASGSPVTLFKVRLPWGAKGRTWAAVFGSSVAAWVIRADNPALAYAVIDALTGYIVLRQPLGEMQRAIGLLSIGMFAVDIGFASACWLQPGPHDLGGYVSFNSLIGWLQWACLVSWGVSDAVARYLGPARRGSGHSVLAGDGL